jgi:uncharacterized membrane protein (UPF0136 family)
MEKESEEANIGVKTHKPLPIGLSVLATYGLFYYGMKYKNGR